jgi:MFS family permease
MTTATQTSGKMFYGWWVVLAAGLGLALHAGPLIVPTFGVFLKPLSQEFGWSRTQISLAFSLFTLGITIAMPLIGRLVDRYGARTVIVRAVLLFGLGVFSLSFLSAHLWHFYALYLFLGVVGSGTAMVPYTKVLSRWFDRKRGLALGLAAATFSVSAALMPPFVHTLIASVGWRRAYQILGLLVIGIIIPVVVRWLKESPQVMGLAPDGETIEPAEAATHGSAEDGMSFQEARQTETFWLMGGAFFLISVGFHGSIIHLVPMLTDRGFSAQSAALVAALPAGAGLIGKIGIGYLLDRCFAPYVAVCFFCGFALGLFLLWSGMTGSVVLMAVVLVGLGIGAELDVMPYVVSRYFGLRAFGEIYSYTFALFTLGGVIGPLLMGTGFDATGSYRLALGVFVLAALTAAGLMARLGPYRTWEAASEAVAIAEDGAVTVSS